MAQTSTAWPVGDGAMAARIRSFDWATTPLGPILQWPRSLKSIVDLMLGSPSMMSLVWGPEAIHLYNDRFTDLLGEHRSLALGRSAYETFARSRDVFAADVAAGMAGRSAQLIAQRYPVLRQGQLTDAWFDVDIVPIRDEAGAVAGVLWTLKETTAQHLAEKALRASEARHRLLLESWAQAEWEADAHGVVVADSPSWRAYTGQTVEEWLGDGWLDAIHPNDRAHAERQWREAITAREVVNTEFRLRAPDGGWRWTNVRAAPVRDEEGAIGAWAGMNIDIDARKRAEAALRESKARYHELFERMAEGFAELEAVRDDGGNLIDFRHRARNPASARVTGLPDEQVLGRLVGEVLPPEDARYWIDAYAQVFVSGEPSHFENFIPALDRWFSINVTPFGSNGVGVFYEDITERKRAEAALRESEEKYRTLFDSIDEGFCVVEVQFDDARQPIDYIFLETNAAFARQTGLAGAVGKRMRELAADHERHWFEVYGQIAVSGEPQRFELRAKALSRWYDVYAFRIGDPDLRHVAILFNDVTQRKQAERELRESEERQAFLLALSDALRPLADAGEIQATTARLLGTHLEVDRAMYAEVTGEPGAETGLIRGQFIRQAAQGRPAPAPFPEHFTYERFGTAVMARRYSGEGLAVADVHADPGFDAAERAAWARVGVQAAIVAPLVKGGRLVAELGVHSQASRTWTDAEISLVREVGERTWAAAERARAEAVSHESEQRFSQFAQASAAGLWIRDAATLTMEYVSPAVTTIYGISSDAILGDPKPWAALVLPEDRDTALAHLEQARRGETVVHEFRIQRPSDGSFRWIRNTDFPLFDVRGRVQRIGGIAQDVTEAKLAVEHTGVLLAELQHRVRNIMAMIRSITARTGERAASVPEYAALMAGRLMTLARVQALLTRAANAGVGITGIVRDELDAQAHHDGQFTIEGPDVILSPKAAEVLTLAVHELATNALKYGGLSVPDGHVTVHWATFEKRGVPWIGLDWTETGAPERPPPDPSQPRRRGFGSELIEGRIPYELGGRGEVVIAPGGARCHLEFPLRDGASILETDAPQRAVVFGGALDMTDEADLVGQRVLMVEDDFYLATDAARALRGAGAEVLGPCPNEEAARNALDEQRPDAVVLDINLGAGPSFKLAETLKDRGIPFVFTTGYDMEVIPAAFDGIPRLQKPVQLRQIVAAIAELVHTSP